MMITARGNDISCIRHEFESKNFIGIEGHTGSGKTTAGKWFSEKMGFELIDTDSYMRRCRVGTGPLPDYHDGFDFEKLSLDLNKALKVSRVVLVGICLRKTLEYIKAPIPFFIYIKCISKNTFHWIENYNLEDFRLGVLSPIPEGVHLSDYQYILDYSPHEIADVVFERIEQ